MIRYCLRLGTSAILFCKKTYLLLYQYIWSCYSFLWNADLLGWLLVTCYYSNEIQWNLYTTKYVVLVVVVVATLAVVERWALWGEPHFYLYLKIYSCPNVLRTYQCSQKLPLDDINLFLVAFFEHLWCKKVCVSMQ